MYLLVLNKGLDCSCDGAQDGALVPFLINIWNDSEKKFIYALKLLIVIYNIRIFLLFQFIYFNKMRRYLIT